MNAETITAEDLSIRGSAFADSPAEAEEWRREYARQRGLSETTSWAEIRDWDKEYRRKRLARRYNLPETSTMKEIEEHKLQLRLAAWEEERKTKARELELPETASDLEISRADRALPEGLQSDCVNYPVHEDGTLVVPSNL